MSTLLSKDQVETLTDEQKDTYAKVVLADSRMRRDVEARARSYRGAKAIPIALGVVCIALMIWTPSLQAIVIIGFLVGALALQGQANGLNRRLDAVLVLLQGVERRATELEMQEETVSSEEDQNQPNNKGCGGVEERDLRLHP